MTQVVGKGVKNEAIARSGAAIDIFGASIFDICPNPLLNFASIADIITALSSARSFDLAILQ